MRIISYELLVNGNDTSIAGIQDFPLSYGETVTVALTDLVTGCIVEKNYSTGDTPGMVSTTITTTQQQQRKNKQYKLFFFSGAPIGISLLLQNATCYGDQVLVSANVIGGVGNYNYTWTNSLGGSVQAVTHSFSAGTYSLVATDGNGCSASKTFTIFQPST